MLDFAKTSARVSARQHFERHIVHDSSRSRLGKNPPRKAGKAYASVKTVRARVKPAVFIHISLAIAPVSAKEQQELAMCCRWDHVSKRFGSAIVIDTRTEGSKGFGHGSKGCSNIMDESRKRNFHKRYEALSPQP